MENLEILFDKNSPSRENEEILIQASFHEETLSYKFIVGKAGVWNTLQDFSSSDTCIWNPSDEGKYLIMVQGKREDSTKPFDYMVRDEYEIAPKGIVKLMEEVLLDETTLTIGEKLKINVKSKVENLLYRFWVRGKEDWESIRDYTSSGELIYTPIKVGNQEILIECKHINSTEIFDEYLTVKFDVLSQVEGEITGFRCLTEDLLVREELVFKVESNLENKRSLLYKFIKITKDGSVSCIQDFSSRQLVSFKEKEPGEYKLLCLMRDMLSNKEYDDRAVMVYKVKAYNEVEIKSFSPDVSSPQLCGCRINLKAKVKGGRELVYRYLIEGEVAEDTGYIRKSEYPWEPKSEGDYKVKLYVKDISYDGDYEDTLSFDFTVDKKGDKPVRIVDIVMDNNKEVLIGQPVNIKVKGEGGISLKYSFIIFKNNVEVERIDYDTSNWIDFTPKEKGEYQIEVRVRDKYSQKDYDSNSYVYIIGKEYLPGEIDYILLPKKTTHLVGDVIEIEGIVQNTQNTLVKFITKINGHLVEDTGFMKNKRIKVKPACAGKYTFEVYSKNVKCQEEFDCKKEVSLYISEATPITDTKIQCDKEIVRCKEEVTFKVTSSGGKDVCYEFYVMEKGNWVKTQSYSKKDYYTFIPFMKGEYRVMVMAKSFYKKVNYEDYGEFIFTSI